MESRLRAFQRAIDEVRTLPLTPLTCGSKNECVVFVTKFKFNQIKSDTKFLCMKTSSSKVEVELVYFPIYITVYIDVGVKRNHST